MPAVLGGWLARALRAAGAVFAFSPAQQRPRGFVWDFNQLGYAGTHRVGYKVFLEVSRETGADGTIKAMQPQSSLLQVAGFEGPFDLLLTLVRERKLDVSEISLRQVTEDFLHYVKSQTMTPERLGDFLVVAATLLLLKVRQLLPRLSPEEAQEVRELTGRLQVYQLFREQGTRLQARWGRAQLFSAGAFSPAFLPAGRQALTSTGKPFQAVPISVAELESAFHRIITRLPKTIDVKAHVRSRGKSLEECVEIFLRRLAQAEKFSFGETVAGKARQEIAVSFLAVLELARQQRLSLQQTPAAELTISKV